MAITFTFDGGQYTNEQGTVLPLKVVKAIVTMGDGSAVTAGRKAAAASQSMALSTEDKSALDAAKGYYSTAVAYVPGTARAAGIGIMALITTTGTVTFTIGGVDVPFTLTAGNPIILNLAVTKVVFGTAVGTCYAMG